MLLKESTPDESDEMDLEFALYKPSSAAKEKLLAHVLGASDGSTADDFLKAVREDGHHYWLYIGLLTFRLLLLLLCDTETRGCADTGYSRDHHQ